MIMHLSIPPISTAFMITKLLDFEIHVHILGGIHGSDQCVTSDPDTTIANPERLLVSQTGSKHHHE